MDALFPASVPSAPLGRGAFVLTRRRSCPLSLLHARRVALAAFPGLRCRATSGSGCACPGRTRPGVAPGKGAVVCSRPPNPGARPSARQVDKNR